MVKPSRVDVVSSFLQNQQAQILLLKRSDSVRTYSGRWGTVSGYVETCDPLLQAEREIREETGYSPSNLSLLKKGYPLSVDDQDTDRHWRVHPFRFTFHGNPRTIQLNREHVGYRWIDPDEMVSLFTVPRLTEALERTFYE